MEIIRRYGSTISCSAEAIKLLVILYLFAYICAETSGIRSSVRDANEDEDCRWVYASRASLTAFVDPSEMAFAVSPSKRISTNPAPVAAFRVAY